jgi:hypothetical protein
MTKYKNFLKRHEGKVTAVQNQQVRTNRTIHVYINKLGLIIRGNKKETCMHVAVPGDRNVFKTESERIVKYEDLIQTFSTCEM